MERYVKWVMYCPWTERLCAAGGKREKTAEIKEKMPRVKLWKSLWKVWITICKDKLFKTLCKIVEFYGKKLCFAA